VHGRAGVAQEMIYKALRDLTVADLLQRGRLERRRRK
jgi:hypothetical protein